MLRTSTQLGFVIYRAAMPGRSLSQKRGGYHPTEESMFCPECKSEYRAGFTRCSGCNRDLVEQLPPEVPETDKALSESANPMVVANYAKRFEAALAKGMLQAAGIEALLDPGDDVIRGRPKRTAGYELLVPGEFLDEAKNILEQGVTTDEPGESEEE